jgi:two-component system response regulator YesN
MKKHFPASEFEAVAEAYKAKTGRSVILVDPEGRVLRRLGDCDFCRRLAAGRTKSLAENCRATLARAVEEAFRWGDGYITTCPVGLILLAVPLVRERRLAAGLVSGFAVFPEMRRDIRDEASASLRRHGARPREFRGRGVLPPVFSLKKAKDDVALLLRLTGRLGANDLDFLRARKEKHLQQQQIAGFLEDLKKANRDVSRQILDKQEEIIQKVKLGDTSGAREILNEFLGTIFFESGMNFDVLKVRVIELVVMISRAAIAAGVDAAELLGLNYSYLTDLNKVSDLDELLQKLTTVLENFISKVSRVKERKRTIRASAMREFIHQNFTRRITARDIAAAAGLSVSRSLHLFKEETGQSVSHYVNRLKIDYGKYLLLNTETSLADLAGELGFYDQSHFTRMFKTFEKMTPSSYRLNYKTEA